MNAKKNEQSDILTTLGITPSKKRGKKWKWVIILLVILVAAGGAFFFTRKPTLASVDQYKTELVARGPLTITVSATGSLKPTKQVDVGSEQSGIVKSVEVTYNDKVTEGQVLAKLDPSILEAEVKQFRAGLEASQASLLQARAGVTEAKNKLKKQQEVWDRSNHKYPSQDEMDTAEINLQKAYANEAAAKASVSQAQASLDARVTNFDKLIIYSPVNGVVLNRAVEPGQTVQASFQSVVLFSLAEDLTRMELHLAVDEADVGLVKEGQDATFTVDAYLGRTFNAKVTQVRVAATSSTDQQQSSSGVVTYETVLSVDNSELLLRPGMTATADITVKEIKDALLIPNAALRYSPSPDELARLTEKPKPDAAASTKAADAGSTAKAPPEAELSTKKEVTPPAKVAQKVWTIKDGKLAAISVFVGETDMEKTEVTGGDLKPGDKLITNTADKADGSVSVGVSI